MERVVKAQSVHGPGAWPSADSTPTRAPENRRPRPTFPGRRCISTTPSRPAALQSAHARAELGGWIMDCAERHGRRPPIGWCSHRPCVDSAVTLNQNRNRWIGVREDHWWRVDVLRANLPMPFPAPRRAGPRSLWQRRFWKPASLGWQLTSETQKRGQPSDEAEPKGPARSTPLVETTRLVDTPGDMMRKSKKRKRPVACRNARGISGSGHLQRSGANAADLQASIGRPTRARWWETRHLQRSAPTLRFSPANRLHRQQPDREARPLSHWPLPPPVAVCVMAGGGRYRTP
jgi:hypothetical protein